MLKKLRRKFVVLTMAMVTVVVIFAFSMIAGITYQRSLDTVYSAMHSSIEQAAVDARASNFRQFAGPGFSGFWDELNGTFSGLYSSNPSGSGSSGSTNGTDASNTDSSSNSGSSDSADNGSSSGRQNSPHSEIGSGNDASLPVAVYKDTDGTLTLVSNASSAIVSTSAFDSVYQQLENSSSDRGTLPLVGLFYVKENVAGSTYYAFASMSSAQDLTGLYVSLIAIAIGTLFVFFIVSLFFSKWALRPVEEAWAKQHQFIADASHELKTPLTVILANSDIMLSHPERTIESQKQWVESTQHEALGMQELVVSMLDLAKMEAESENAQGNAGPTLENVNLSELAFGTTLQFESRAFEGQTELVDDIDDDLHVMGEKTALERLCATLLDNACKYSPEGGTITVSLKRKDASTYRNRPHTARQGDLPRGTAVVLSVANEGPAIDPDDLPHLFDRFYRSDKARTHEGVSNSYGLGLAIAANTVTAHKGCIMATSVEGEGTVFTVVLPIAK